MSERPKYSETAEQLYNLVDNDKDKIDAFLSAKAAPEGQEKAEVQRWIDNYVKSEELNDLFHPGETKAGFVKWLSDDSNNGYLEAYLKCIDSSTYQEEGPILSYDTSILQSDMEKEDDELYNDVSVMSDASTGDDKADDPDEIDLAFAALDNDEDIDITFEIVDGSEDDSSEDIEVTVKEPEGKKKKGRTKVHLNHTINRVVKDIDDEEIVDRLHHEKYYVAKKEQLGDLDSLDKLEEELDKQLISYYDFPHCSIKMYESNEVKMNRIFKKLGFKFRCRDIAKYTKNWHAK